MQDEKCSAPVQDEQGPASALKPALDGRHNLQAATHRKSGGVAYQFGAESECTAIPEGNFPCVRTEIDQIIRIVEKEPMRAVSFKVDPTVAASKSSCFSGR